MSQKENQRKQEIHHIQESLPNISHQEVGVIEQEFKLDYSNHQQVDDFLKAEFFDVTPSNEDFYLGKLYSYKIAAERLKKEEEERRRMERIKMHTSAWTSEQIAKVALNAAKAIGVSEGFDFVLDDYNKPVFDLLCLYFSGDKRFEDHGIGGMRYSLDKGIWLQSEHRGTGKTVLLKSFYLNKRCCFGYKHSEELRVLFQKNGFDGIDRFIGTISQPSSALNFYQSEAGFMYDELFGEEKVMHMGSPLSLSGYIINKLYDFSKNYKKEKWKFHCTSNADGSDIENIVGKTFRSRMADMFNLIKLDGSDRRKN